MTSKLECAISTVPGDCDERAEAPGEPILPPRFQCRGGNLPASRRMRAGSPAWTHCTVAEVFPIGLSLGSSREAAGSPATANRPAPTGTAPGTVEGGKEEGNQVSAAYLCASVCTSRMLPMIWTELPCVWESMMIDAIYP